MKIPSASNEQRAAGSRMAVLAGTVGLLVVLVAAIRFASDSALGRFGLAGATLIESVIALVILFGRIRTRKVKHERQQMSALLSAIRSGVL